MLDYNRIDVTVRMKNADLLKKRTTIIMEKTIVCYSDVK